MNLTEKLLAAMIRRYVSERDEAYVVEQAIQPMDLTVARKFKRAVYTGYGIACEMKLVERD